MSGAGRAGSASSSKDAYGDSAPESAEAAYLESCLESVRRRVLDLREVQVRWEKDGAGYMRAVAIDEAVRKRRRKAGKGGAARLRISAGIGASASPLGGSGAMMRSGLS